MENASAIKASAASTKQADMLRLGIAGLFLAGIALYVVLYAEQLGVAGSAFVVIAAVIGGYMAINIGANDVANNVGPSVGSGAISLGGAIAIAFIFEASGAIIAGSEVVGTIRSGIINPDLIPDPNTFMWLMMGALLAAALWINLATVVGAPVSTTHSIVGGVLGGGIAAGGLAIANWDVIGRIVASWVISPVMGGLIAATFLYIIKRTITYKKDMSTAAAQWVPVLIAAMGFAAATYMMMKGMGRLMKVEMWQAYVIGAIAFILVYLLVKPILHRRREKIENSKEGVNALFTIPLVFAIALLSFAHGSNDVANAIGPLAAIIALVSTGGAEIATAAAVPLWVLVIGGLSLSVGLWLFGPKIIRVVGSQITELDRSRAYCIAMAATITVIIASQFGIPVSTTHITVGAVVGVGLLREFLKVSYERKIADIRAHHHDQSEEAVNDFIERFERAGIQERGLMLQMLKLQSKDDKSRLLSKKERKGLGAVYRKEIVKRDLIYKIVASWVITVPAAALLSAMLFFTIRGMLLQV